MRLNELMEKQGERLFRFRGTLPLVILALGAYCYMRTELHPELFPMEDTRAEYFYEMACLFISLFGLAVRVFTVGYTPEKTSGRNTHGQVAQQLNTTGLYSIVRNPLYLGNFLMWLGVGLLTRNFWFIVAFCLFYWLYYERIIIAEERFLTQKFGDEYIKWANTTPCFIPRLKGYVKPTYKFSWKKAIKKEKNGLLAVFLIFCVLHVAGELASGNPPHYLWMIYVTAFLIVAYFVLKIIKHKTSLLNEQGR